MYVVITALLHVALRRAELCSVVLRCAERRGRVRLCGATLGATRRPIPHGLRKQTCTNISPPSGTDGGEIWYTFEIRWACVCVCVCVCDALVPQALDVAAATPTPPRARAATCYKTRNITG